MRRNSSALIVRFSGAHRRFARNSRSYKLLFAFERRRAGRESKCGVSNSRLVASVRASQYSEERLCLRVALLFLVSPRTPLSKMKSKAAEGALIFGPRERERWGDRAAASSAKRTQSMFPPLKIASSNLINSVSLRPALSKVVSIIDVSFQAAIKTLARAKIARRCRPGTARKRMASKTGRRRLLSLASRLPHRTAIAAIPRAAMGLRPCETNRGS
jgi:hypothetical protein